MHGPDRHLGIRAQNLLPGALILGNSSQEGAARTFPWPVIFFPIKGGFLVKNASILNQLQVLTTMNSSQEH